MLHKAKDILHKHELRHTSFREQLLDIFIKKPTHALSQSQLEEALGPHDRITLYRTLKSFVQSGLLHKALDISEETKYALCQDHCNVHEHNDDHPHFSCVKCGNTQCLEDVNMPEFSLPKNYKLQEVQMALSGICDRCNS